MCYNWLNSGPNLMGRKRVLIQTETAAISSYFNNSIISLNNKGKPWLDIVENASIILLITIHFKPAGSCIIIIRTVQYFYKLNKDLINTVCEEEKEFIRLQTTAWLNQINK